MELIFGTWKLDPIYKKVESWIHTEKIIEYAIEKNILSFDTAIAYGNGKIEEILGKYNEMSNLNIITKIPAKIRTKEINTDINELYPENWIEKNIVDSTYRLKCNNHTVLLHNYENWVGIEQTIDKLHRLREQGYMKFIGISISNNYKSKIPSEVLMKIDFIEAPYNEQELWIEHNFEMFRNKEIALRSLLKYHTGILKKESFEKPLSISNKLIVGMTTIKQIEENIKIFENLGV